MLSWETGSVKGTKSLNRAELSKALARSHGRPLFFKVDCMSLLVKSKPKERVLPKAVSLGAVSTVWSLFSAVSL